MRKGNFGRFSPNSNFSRDRNLYLQPRRRLPHLPRQPDRHHHLMHRKPLMMHHRTRNALGTRYVVSPFRVSASPGIGRWTLDVCLEISFSAFRYQMSIAELERVTKAWPPISRAVRVPHTEEDYRQLVEFLDRVTDEVGEDESHTLASLMDVLGVLIEKYEDEHVPEL